METKCTKLDDIDFKTAQYLKEISLEDCELCNQREGSILLTDIDAAKKIVGEALKEKAHIDVLSEIILYNTETMIFFFWKYRHFGSDDDTSQCNSDFLAKQGGSCEGKPCTLCPNFSFVPKGFNKFAVSEELPGELIFSL